MVYFYISVWLLALLAGAVFLWAVCGPDDQSPIL